MASTTFSVLVRGFLTILTFVPAAVVVVAGVAFLVVVAVGFVARGFLVVVEGADAFPTRPEATLLDADEERGLDVFAFVFEVGVRVDWMVERRRGLEFPVFFKKKS